MSRPERYQPVLSEDNGGDDDVRVCVCGVYMCKYHAQGKDCAEQVRVTVRTEVSAEGVARGATLSSTTPVATKNMLELGVS